MSYSQARMSPPRAFAEDHLRTLKLQLLDYQKQGYLTDLQIATDTGILSVHKAMVCSVLPGLRSILQSQTVEEDVVLILPGGIMENVAKAVEEVYLKSDNTSLSKILDIDAVEEKKPEESKVFEIPSPERKRTVFDMDWDVKVEDVSAVENKATSIKDDDFLHCIEADLEDASESSDLTKSDTKDELDDGVVDNTDTLLDHIFTAPRSKKTLSQTDQLLPDNFWCNKCYKSCSSARDLRRHKTWMHQSEQKPVVHFGKTRHVCETCGVSFLTAPGLTRHNTRIHKLAKCKRQRPKELKPKPAPEAFICEKCPHIFDSQSKLENHLDLSHRPVECPVCKKTISNKYNLKMHIKNHSGENKVTCDVCGMQLSTQQLKPHYLAKHTKERPQKCDQCDFGTVTKQALIRHINAYHNNIKYPCMICGLPFSDKASLGVHERTVHSDARNFICYICKKGFKLNAKMQRHVLNSHGKKDFLCKICNKGFTSKEYLLNHEKSHNEENQYKCTFCTKSFVTRQKRTEHIYSHTGEKPFLCPSFRCDRRFNSSSSLAHHKKACVVLQVEMAAKEKSQSSEMAAKETSQSSDTGFSSGGAESSY